MSHITETPTPLPPEVRKTQLGVKGHGTYRDKLEIAVVANSGNNNFGGWKIIAVIVDGLEADERKNIETDEKLRCSCTHTIYNAFVMYNVDTEMEMQIGMCCIKKFKDKSRFGWISNNILSDMSAFARDFSIVHTRLCLSEGIRNMAEHLNITTAEKSRDYMLGVRMLRNKKDSVLLDLIAYELPIVRKFVSDRRKYRHLLELHMELSHQEAITTESLKAADLIQWKSLKECFAKNAAIKREKALLSETKINNINEARNNRWINFKEYNFLIDMVRKEYLTEKQAQWKDSIVRKIRRLKPAVVTGGS